MDISKSILVSNVDVKARQLSVVKDQVLHFAAGECKFVAGPQSSMGIKFNVSVQRFESMKDLIEIINVLKTSDSIMKYKRSGNPGPFPKEEEDDDEEEDDYEQDDDDNQNQGGSEQGGSDGDPGGSEQGGSEQGGSEKGGSEQGGSEKGGSEKGGSEQGGSDGDGGSEQDESDGDGDGDGGTEQDKDASDGDQRSEQELIVSDTNTEIMPIVPSEEESHVEIESSNIESSKVEIIDINQIMPCEPIIEDISTTIAVSGISTIHDMIAIQGICDMYEVDIPVWNDKNVFKGMLI